MRIQYLDSLRGVAILLVLGFHAYVAWPARIPYGDTYSEFPVFKFGWLGVELFFLISGFVIFMTLDKTETFKNFIYKRWLRLFPAMLFASILIYFTAPIFYERPAGNPNAFSLIPGLTFTEPGWWKKILGIHIKPLEGAFWSLYVEFKFYFIAGAIYFSLGRRFLVPFLIGIFIFTIFIYIFSMISNFWALNIFKKICVSLSFKYFGWFSSGALYYLYSQTNNNKWFLYAILLSALSSLTVKSLDGNYNIHIILAASIISSLFAASVKNIYIQQVLQNKIFLFFGFISYPLYLIHENAMISMLIKSPTYMPWLHSFMYPYPAITILSAISYLIAKNFEPTCRKLIALITQTKITIYLNKQ